MMNARDLRTRSAVLLVAAFAGVALAQAPAPRPTAQTPATGPGDNPVLTGQPEPPPSILTLNHPTPVISRPGMARPANC